MKWADRVLYSVVKCHHYLSQQLICWSKLPDISSSVQRTPIFSPNRTAAVVAEWLRRLTRNQMGSARAGSNPADCEFFFKDCCTDC